MQHSAAAHADDVDADVEEGDEDKEGDGDEEEEEDGDAGVEEKMMTSNLSGRPDVLRVNQARAEP